MEKSTKKRAKIVWIVLIAALLVVLLSFLYQVFIAKPEIKNSSWKGPVNENNVCEFFSGTNLIKDLSKNSVLSFKTYDFDAGYRNIGTSCTIVKGEVLPKRTTEYDAEIQLHKKYVSGLGEDVCKTIQTSRKTDDLSFELNTNSIKFFFKYINTLKYGNCAGFV